MHDYLVDVRDEQCCLMRCNVVKKQGWEWLSNNFTSFGIDVHDEHCLSHNQLALLKDKRQVCFLTLFVQVLSQFHEQLHTFLFFLTLL